MLWWWWWWQLKISVLHHASCHLMHGHKKLDWLVNSLLTTRFLEMLFWEIHSRSCLQLHQGGWVQIWNNKHSEVLTCLSGQAPLTHRRRSINIRPVQVGFVLSEPKYTQKLSYLWNVTRKQALTNTENTKIFRIIAALLLLLYCINRQSHDSNNTKYQIKFRWCVITKLATSLSSFFIWE